MGPEGQRYTPYSSSNALWSLLTPSQWFGVAAGAAALLVVLGASGLGYLLMVDPFGQGPGKASYNGITIRAAVVMHAGPMVILSMRVDIDRAEENEVDDVTMGDMIGASGKALHPQVRGPMPADVVFYTTDGSLATDVAYTLRVVQVMRNTPGGRYSHRGFQGSWTLRITAPMAADTYGLPAPTPIDTGPTHISFDGFRYNQHYVIGTMETAGIASAMGRDAAPTSVDQPIFMTLRDPNGRVLDSFDITYPAPGVAGSARPGRQTSLWRLSGFGSYELRVFVGRHSGPTFTQPIQIT